MAEQCVLDKAQRSRGCFLRRLAGPVWVRVWRVEHAAKQCSKAFPLDGSARRQRERTHGPAVKTPEKRDELIAAGSVTGKLHRGLGGLGPRVAEVDTAGDIARSNTAKLFGELHHALVIKIGAGH